MQQVRQSWFARGKDQESNGPYRTDISTKSTVPVPLGSHVWKRSVEAKVTLRLSSFDDHDIDILVHKRRTCVDQSVIQRPMQS